ncbi:hypothetical protein [Aureimonas leprariae]|uniref:Uncharacterized protein n=1 Tax=Plantimonas leprariae TaxID=2615207 RepID=A0A7V7PL93_9HYPH|nr:hypothetical protein [Aureimonas leprariae]KAB0676858.1 hypothetical protein F6X38_20010 [Aureimonas leprariae]
MTAALLPGAAEPAGLSRRGRDFLLLWIFVQVRHGYPERAAAVADALRRLGDGSAEVATAEAVLAFLAGRWRDTLARLDELDRIDPLERFGSYRLTERQRMRRYLRTRCLFELGDEPRAKDALEAYLRHGETGEEAE